MNEFSIALVVMLVAICVINAVCFTVLKTSKHHVPIGATLSYFVIAIGFYYIDVHLYLLEWSIAVYMICFIVVPVAVYYVMHKLVNGLQKQAEKETRHTLPTQPLQKKPATTPPLQKTPEPIQKAPVVVPEIAPLAKTSPKPAAHASAMPRKRGIAAEALQQTTVHSVPTTLQAQDIRPRKQRASIPGDSERTAVVPNHAAKQTTPVKQEFVEKKSSTNHAVPVGTSVIKPNESMTAVPEKTRTTKPNETITVVPEKTKEKTAPVVVKPEAPRLPLFDAALARAQELKAQKQFTLAAAVLKESISVAKSDEEKISALFEEIACYIEGKNKVKAQERAGFLKENYQLDRGKSTKLEIILQLLERN